MKYSYITGANAASETTDKVFETPGQTKLEKEILVLQIKLDSARRAKNAGLENDDTSCIKKIEAELKKKEKHLIKLKKGANRQKLFREKKKKAIEQVLLADPKLSTVLKSRQQSGRPRIETDQPDLLKTIIQLTAFGAPADHRRRSEKLNACKTLNDLHQELLSFGYSLSKSATYLRLLPKKSNTMEGKRHVQTVPVQIRKAQNNLHKNHIDQNFCKATIRSLEELASILGPHQAIFLSQDDKARVPLGLAAANKQAPILMHMEYQVRKL